MSFKRSALCSVFLALLSAANFAVAESTEHLSEQEQNLLKEQLPMEIQLDLLVADLEQQVQIKAYGQATSTISQIRSLDVPSPTSLLYFEGAVLAGEGKVQEGKELLNAYLEEGGKNGEYHTEAQASLEVIRQELQRREQLRLARLREFKKLNANVVAAINAGNGKQALQLIEDVRRFGLPVSPDILFHEGEARLLANEAVVAKSKFLKYIEVNGRSAKHYKRATRLYAQANQFKRTKFVEVVQDELKRLGYTIDQKGIMASRTRSAIEQFQKDQGLAVTGRVGPDLLSRLKATSPKVNDCDRLAAHPGDGRATAAGVAYRKINAKKAVAACKLAVTRYPKVSRYKFQYGRALDAAKRRSEAVEWFRKSASEGYPSAMVSLGYSFEKGRGVFQDAKAAADWYKRAANAGASRGQLRLAHLYLTGTGVPKNLGEARSWFEKAAEKGDAQAQYSLGEMYLGGLGVSKNETIAKRWLRKSAAQGHEQAKALLSRGGTNVAGIDKALIKKVQKELNRLGYKAGPADGLTGGRTLRAIRKFQKAQGLEQSGKVTSRLLTKLRKVRSTRVAARPKVEFGTGSPATSALGINVGGGGNASAGDARRVTKPDASDASSAASCMRYAGGSRTMAEIAETSAARDCRDAVRTNPSSSKYKLLYGKALMSIGEFRAARSWLTRAANKNSREAQFYVGQLYENGQGVGKNFDKAVTWYRRAAKAGQRTAAARLVKMYDAGLLQTMPRSEVRSWRKAVGKDKPAAAPAPSSSNRLTDLEARARRGENQAQYQLGLAHMRGDGVETSYEKAVKWYTQAAESGHREAMNKLGYMYENGFGVPIDIQVALDWYRKAAER